MRIAPLLPRARTGTDWGGFDHDVRADVPVPQLVREAQFDEQHVRVLVGRAGIDRHFLQVRVGLGLCVAAGLLAAGDLRLLPGATLDLDACR